MSLWRKRGTSDTIAPFARHDGQNTPKLFKMTAMTDNDLSIKSEDLSIKSEPYKSTRQELREQIEGLERDYDLLLTKYKLLLAEKSPEVKESLTTEQSARLWVDPPEGWKYGFPAIYDPDTDGQMSDWIISKGYPIQIIKEYGEQWMVRCWPAEEPH